MNRPFPLSPVAFVVLSVLATGCPKKTENTQPETPSAPERSTQAPSAPAATDTAPALPADFPHALLIAYAQFEVEGGRVTARPGPARLEMLQRVGGEWSVEAIEDDESAVFHKAMVLQPSGQTPGILTLGGSAPCAEAGARNCKAQLKLWRRNGDQFDPTLLWESDFGGTRNRMRDAEVGPLLQEGHAAVAVGTHDQGVVAVVAFENGKPNVTEIDRKDDTWVHEIELGDLDGDGKLEIYATPSEPNRLRSGGEQHGEVIRYVPSATDPRASRTLVADLGNRHAKEIFVDDVDGDGTDELYVAVEALTRSEGGRVELVEPVELRRYDANTAPDAGVVIATLPDRFTRFLTAGDVDGDGKKELVAASFKSGLWLLRPGQDPRSEWSKESLDRDSGGFEHAALLTDLDGDGRDELYVAADTQGELRCYRWKDGLADRETIHRRDLPLSRMTWNLMPVPRTVIHPDAP